jgi:hypothetical protein
MTVVHQTICGATPVSVEPHPSPPPNHAPSRCAVLCNNFLSGGFKANSHIPCRSPAALIHTCHAAPLPFSNSAVSFMKVRVVDGNIRTATPATTFLVTTFVELRVVAGRSRTREVRTHAVFGRPMLIHTYHAVPMPRCAVALRSRFQNGMVVARHGDGTGAAWHV